MSKTIKRRYPKISDTLNKKLEKDKELRNWNIFNINSSNLKKWWVI